MFKFERTATNSVSFVITFLIARTKCELVDEINGCSPLTIGHDLVFELPIVVLSDTINVFLGGQLKNNEMILKTYFQLSCFLEFLVVTLALNIRVGC